jgi:HD-like signal output (HDOD) protein
VGLWKWLTGGSDQTPTGNTQPADTGSGAAVAVAEPPAAPTPAAPQPPEPAAIWWAPPGATLREPAPAARPELSTETRALENVLISQFDGHDLNLPPLPHVPERVLKCLHNPRCDFSRIADEVSADPVIAAAVLRMANSPLYRGVEKVTALNTAISRLGSNALRTLMLNQSLRAVTLGGKDTDPALAGMIWRRSLAAATVARGLSTFAGIDPEEAFLAGLLHDIGNAVVLREARKQHRHVTYALDPETFEYLCFECHQEFGELLAVAWALPADLQTLIANHHQYPATDDPLRRPRLLLQLTDMTCALLGYAPSFPYDLPATRAAQDLGLSERPDFVQFLADLPAEVEETIPCF